MTTFRPTVNFLGMLVLCLLAQPEFAFAKQLTRSQTVRVNKPAIVYEFALLNARTDHKGEKCHELWMAPSIIVRRKPKIGKVRIRKGVKIVSPKNSSCKGKRVLGTTVEYTGTKRGRDSFKVEVLFARPGYYDHKFGDVTINVTVR